MQKTCHVGGWTWGLVGKVRSCVESGPWVDWAVFLCSTQSVGIMTQLREKGHDFSGYEW